MTQALNLIQPLLHSDLPWLVATLATYLVSVRIFKASGRKALLNPLLLSMVILIALLELTHTPYTTYRQGAELINFLLGPATVALAVPLFEYRHLLLKMWMPLAGGLIVGSLVTIGSVVALGHLADLPLPVILSLAPKAVTTPMALGIAQSAGGDVPLVVVFTMSTGICGAVFGLMLLRALRVRDHAICGFTMGLGASGVAAARCFEESEEMGAFAGLAVGLNGVFTALAVPLLIHWHIWGL
ncbi:LrgB family protein [Mangrovitalea sediminis]|uniref:LrgB family protein n=1 Tax=Mangrovitalea sediminis TaxID=1982043 RepID=UPI000BE5DBD0|nr:LrgB family protein [Mangrovitalea sediminis]